MVVLEEIHLFVQQCLLQMVEVAVFQLGLVVVQGQLLVALLVVGAVVMVTQAVVAVVLEAIQVMAEYLVPLGLVAVEEEVANLAVIVGMDMLSILGVQVAVA
jgi:hypothetical protein